MRNKYKWHICSPSYYSCQPLEDMVTETEFWYQY
jgi:hypothetical protein